MLYKAIRFSDKHVFVNYFDQYGMDVLNDTNYTVYKLTPEHLQLVEDSRVSKTIKNSEYASEDVDVDPTWSFVLKQGIRLVEALDTNRVSITI